MDFKYLDNDSKRVIGIASNMEINGRHYVELFISPIKKNTTKKASVLLFKVMAQK
ncbi:hypothetical protein MOO44_00625 (plasmid) [Nicoliella spurrieriana]|uniref:Uncharacterized protein n=1 Tax=Nicoliella spurrieriana TaxID=2925830 RepID=A0A976RQV3_9LACO|nr:hypothetical protein [Nicoliella spurrieriana]UQS86178.1 hypothetical protein MOO44_00625 [Nicoliella spurrieriana]